MHPLQRQYAELAANVAALQRRPAIVQAAGAPALLAAVLELLGELVNAIERMEQRKP